MKLAAFLLMGISAISEGSIELQQVHRKSISPVSVAGTLGNLHTVTKGYRSSPTQHFDIITTDGKIVSDLHADDGLLFVKAENGQTVEATYTRETGYVSDLRIIGGPHPGYEFRQPDSRNAMPSYFLFFVGMVLACAGVFGWIVDHNADPSL